MPRYDYACTFCDNIVDVERSLTDEEIVPKCYLCEEPTKRIYGIAGTHFKGQGWGKVYRTHKPKGNGID
jgi:putative FmdB family regulatory protein